jgi:hypothetical protein
MDRFSRVEKPPAWTLLLIGAIILVFFQRDRLRLAISVRHPRNNHLPMDTLTQALEPANSMGTKLATKQRETRGYTFRRRIQRHYTTSRL